ncbi:MAG: orotate phosphoribosyltransferase [Candidatus Hermodarchaeota archaeon]
MNWKKEENTFYDFIIENKVVGFFDEPLKLKSGRLSHWYVNWRDIAEDVYLLDQLTNYLIAFVEHLKLDIDCFYGVPEGATKLGIITQYKWAKKKPNFRKGVYSLPMGRAKPKEHGNPKDKYYLGIPRGNVVILEDSITTGESLLNTVEKLKELKIDITAVICLTNRNEKRDDGKTVKEILKSMGIEFYAMSNAIDLLPRVYHIQKPNPIIKTNVESYFKKYGTKQIKLS